MAKINPREMRKRDHHTFRANVRLIKTGERPTAKEVEKVFRFMLARHRIPKGWKFAMIEWSHAKSASRGWREGSVRDLKGTLQYILPDLLESLRIGVDRARSGGDVWEIEIAMEY